MGFFSSIFGTPDQTELVEAIKQGANLVDVRTENEFAAGSVKGAVNIPLDQLQNQLSKLKDKEPIVVFCRSGARSNQAKNLLKQHNFCNVIDGGSWKDVKEIANG